MEKMVTLGLELMPLKVEKGTIATDWDTSNADKVSLNEFTKKTTEIEKSVGVLQLL